jgi:ParB family transcriptional regulator, chromosome partitioning protein
MEAEAIEISRAVWGRGHRTDAGGPVEWFTPAEVIAAARAVLGEIDLDPASCEVAQRTVRAKQFFTKRDDGLKQPWRGRLWLNPPQTLIADFVSKLVKERSAGNVIAAVVLSHNFTDAAWFHELAGAASRICFTNGRIKFLLEGSEVATPPYGQAVTYVGDDARGFERAFGRSASSSSR